jgi:predicted Rossmann fold nucleotide-binding protein DprA/Smf involved in DNA uptake
MSESLAITDPRYPPRLRERLGKEAPAKLCMLGNAGLLDLPKTALLCSARCPGSAILRAYDQTAHWRDTGRCVISGFHSPVEKECLRILLRGTSPVIICPARSLPKRIPPEWKAPLAADRMLILSIFPSEESRITSALAARRNEAVAALADEVWFAHVTEGGQTEQLNRRVQQWRHLTTIN